MKSTRLLAICMAAVSVSCTVEPIFDPIESQDGRIPLNIDGSINQVATKATAAGFVDKDAVGLFAVNYTENNTVAGALEAEGNQADNVKYVFDEPNYKWVPARPVYYKDINTNVDLYLYYPYQGSITDVNHANFEVQKDQSSAATSTALSGYEASDWMWGKATNITPTESKVSIPLSHKLSAIQVTLNEGTGWESGEFEAQEKGVIVTNTTRKATLNYATGEVAPVGNPQLDGIVMCPQTDGTFRAIVIPQTVDAGTSLFSITVNGISYSFTQNNPVTYQQGKQLNVSINIKKKTPAGDFELELADAQIVPWTEDLNTHGGEARQYFVVNVETPGTLSDVIAAMEKNPAKIRNLKVTGTVNADDFYFMRDNMEILEAVNMKESRIENDMIPSSAFQNKSSLLYFVFPEYLESIGGNAFNYSGLSGTVIIPEHVKNIGGRAFYMTSITSVQFSKDLESIGQYAFSCCYSLTGDLLLPDGLLTIGEGAFSQCSFNGRLSLPDSIESIARYAFQRCGSFIGDLRIPDKITALDFSTFYETIFSGQLIINNLQELGSNNFEDCQLSGALVIPEGVTEIKGSNFWGNKFSSVSFPSTLRKIHESAFRYCYSICEPIIFPEGVVSIGRNAFSDCQFIPSIVLPSTLQSIQDNAFLNCFNISSITCNAIEPPTVVGNAFNGIAKDNFTVEVPEQSVIRYQSEPGWGDFRRFAAHYEFSLSRRLMRTLNASLSQSFVLQAPANHSWSIQEKPDWVTVEPASGTGKANIMVTVSEMTSSDVSTFEVNDGTFNNANYHIYDGRSAEIVFQLDGIGYTCSMTVEQYDSEYSDGQVQTLQSATHGPGIDIVFTGDGYDAQDIAKGVFMANAQDGYGHLFDVEPYKTYKNYFNVYAVTALSDNSGIGTLNTIVDTKFGSTFTQSRLQIKSQDEVFAWAKRADASMDLSKSLVILLQNTSTYEGITYMYADGSAIACCPVSTQAYPYDFRGIVQHEAGGHGFGKLADEYIYHNAFIQNCRCPDGCEHPQGDDDLSTTYGQMKARGWFKNLSMTSDVSRVPWAHMVYNPQYSNYVDIYEGGYMHTRGMFRSEATSCMNNNIPYFSAISRQAIVERIKYCAGETFSLEEFYANDSRLFGPHTRSGGKYAIESPFSVDPHMNHATGHGPILVGEHPNVK